MKKKDDKKAVTKVSGLSARVAKADELRRAYKRLADKATRTRKTAKEEMANASTPEERSAVRKRFLKRIDATKIEASQAWNGYKDYLQKTFGIDNVYSETNEAYTGTETGFIDWLQAKFTKRKKK